MQLGKLVTLYHEVACRQRRVLKNHKWHRVRLVILPWCGRSPMCRGEGSPGVTGGHCVFSSEKWDSPGRGSWVLGSCGWRTALSTRRHQGRSSAGGSILDLREVPGIQYIRTRAESTAFAGPADQCPVPEDAIREFSNGIRSDTRILNRKTAVVISYGSPQSRASCPGDDRKPEPVTRLTPAATSPATPRQSPRVPRPSR